MVPRVLTLLVGIIDRRGTSLIRTPPPRRNTLDPEA